MIKYVEPPMEKQNGLVSATIGIAIFLCDLTGHMAEPWVEAGYHAVLVDPQHQPGVVTEGRVTRVGDVITGSVGYIGELLRSGRVVFVMGFPPCTDVAVSGSRWFAEKAKRDPHFQTKAALVAEQCRMIGELSGAPWAFENPVSVFSSIFGKPHMTFHPYEFTELQPADNYTKNTCLWTGGGFKSPASRVHKNVAQAIGVVIAEFGRMVPKRQAMEKFGGSQLVSEWYPDNRIHDAPPGEDRANFRSATPKGFARAVFEANRPPHLQLALAS